MEETRAELETQSGRLHQALEWNGLEMITSGRRLGRRQEHWLGLFRHVMRWDEEDLARAVLGLRVEGKRGRGDPNSPGSR